MLKENRDKPKKEAEKERQKKKEEQIKRIKRLIPNNEFKEIQEIMSVSFAVESLCVTEQEMTKIGFDPTSTDCCNV